MKKEFEGKNYWALILGGSSGLGLASAKKLAEHGMNICIIHRNSRSEMTSIIKEFDAIEALGIQLEAFNIDIVRKEKQEEVIRILSEIFTENDKIRTVVHSIAKGNLKPMVTETDNKPELNIDDFNITINAMAISFYDWSKTLFEAKLLANDARIMSFTSEGNKKVWKNYAAVSTAKVSLEAIMRNMALEFAPYGIRTNCIQAGVTDTISLRMIPGSDKIIAHALERNPFKQLTKPEDVANVVYLLSKDEAQWINGCIIPVDGGEHIS